MKVGILSLQGSFFDHQKSLDLISLESLLVKTPEDLDKVDGIILPGGESTAMSKISSYNNLYKKLDTKIKQGLPIKSVWANFLTGMCFSALYKQFRDFWHMDRTLNLEKKYIDDYFFSCSNPH